MKMKQKQHLSFCWFLATISISISICSSLLFFSCDAQRLCSSPPSSCGSIRNISYPFRLKTDPPNCGDRDCELSCEANQTFFYLESVGRYYVESISYENQTIRLIDLELANNTCSPFSWKILGYYVEIIRPLFQLPYPYPNGEVSFLNCSRAIDNPEYKSLPCFNNSQFLDYYIYFYVGEEVTLQDLNDLRNCRIVAAAPLQTNYGDRWDNKTWRNNDNASFPEIRSRLWVGFDMSWSEVVAQDCELGPQYPQYNFGGNGEFLTVSCISPPRGLRVAAEKLLRYVIKTFKIWIFIVSGEATGDEYFDIDPAFDKASEDTFGDLE